MSTVQRIVTLDNEIEARLLESELKSREIPHAIVSYHDAAFDGAFQLARGWGHVEAPVEFKDEILSALQNLRQNSSD